MVFAVDCCVCVAYSFAAGQYDDRIQAQVHLIYLLLISVDAA